MRITTHYHSSLSLFCLVHSVCLSLSFSLANRARLSVALCVQSPSFQGSCCCCSPFRSSRENQSKRGKNARDAARVVRTTMLFASARPFPSPAALLVSLRAARDGQCDDHRHTIIGSREASRAGCCFLLLCVCECMLLTVPILTHKHTHTHSVSMAADIERGKWALGSRGVGVGWEREATN